MSIAIAQAVTRHSTFGWLSIVRLGLVQASIGAIVVMTTSTLNRIMVVELALPASLPGLLVAIHYFVQVIRPRMGFESDSGSKKTPWIIGGVALLALGGFGAAIATTLMGVNLIIGILAAIVAFFLIGIGVSMSGTSLLALLAKGVSDDRRAAAATTVWLMMIFGFALTSGLAGKFLDPYAPEKVILISGIISLVAIALTSLALYRLEGSDLENKISKTKEKIPFKSALSEILSDPDTKKFTIFIFLSMLAFSAQDLILEPFAGIIFKYTLGETTSLSGIQHSGVLTGMLLVAVCGSSRLRRYFGSLRSWMIYGCLASALAMFGLVMAGILEGEWPLKLNVYVLGLANGAFSIAAIASMMRLAVVGGGGKEGVRIGLWGGAQAIAFGLGGLLGAGASDLARSIFTNPAWAYASVFFIEAILFVASAYMASLVERKSTNEFKAG
ncbi:BCD family MFS transporter [Polynucleobacter sp. MWH-Adler-W8]|jgi:BCD family chlorophyll transporter-like MFS transporter|uniref:BCD family MFS transporter n=1 Tax=Polynucleobacter sp. MWH-Adler-W8 TaxID=1819727 RepID=UPI0009274AF7|nr:BCD family MFS transporter [Polynucleobacter sp. MWH-Adler-W8]OJI04148.1 bacteriochlorophyll synthase [Polynucleobacter sp. MWH-Adler-W8]